MKLRFLSACALALFPATFCSAQSCFVSPAGDDGNPGSLEKPFATPQRAQQVARQKGGDVFPRGGTHYPPVALAFTAQESGKEGAPMVHQNYRDEKLVFIGVLNWLEDAECRVIPLRDSARKPAESAVKVTAE